VTYGDDTPVAESARGRPSRFEHDIAALREDVVRLRLDLRQVIDDHEADTRAFEAHTKANLRHDDTASNCLELVRKLEEDMVSLKTKVEGADVVVTTDSANAVSPFVQIVYNPGPKVAERSRLT
jgi:hypothetical protein